MINEQKILNHITALVEKHKVLHKEIEEAYAKFERDEVVEKMKLKKLHLKDEIEMLKRQIKESKS